jgi:release factor glutamine methyltransferase
LCLKWFIIAFRITMTIAEKMLEFRQELSTLYDPREAKNITEWVLEKLVSLDKMQLVFDKHRLLTAPQIDALDAALARLKKAEPVQYVLEEADFMGQKFYVNNAVLIPRPETEELVDWALKQMKDRPTQIDILDIGTGSGCIPISLSLSLPKANIEATDVSEAALKVANKNNSLSGNRVKFYLHNILIENLAAAKYDLITSNPPYIATTESNSMAQHVLEFEPHLALFVEGEDVLLFYREIAAKAFVALKKNGVLLVEIHHEYGSDIVEIFKQSGLANVECRKDLSGKDRMVKGEKP